RTLQCCNSFPPLRPLLLRQDERRYVARTHALAREGRQYGRERLCGPGLLAGNVAGRYRTLLDGPERLSVDAIEGKEKPMLRRDRHGVHLAPLMPHRYQLRRCGGIVVPEVVVDHLEVPEPLAAAGVQRQQRV